MRRNHVARARLGIGAVLAATLTAGLLAFSAVPASAAADGVVNGLITTAGGPVTQVSLGADLRSQLVHKTLGGAYFQPTQLPASNTGPIIVDAASQVLYADAAGMPDGQDSGGTGTRTDPYWISASRTVANTLKITKTDSYVPGDAYVTSKLTYTNLSPASATLQMSYWVDCFLGGADQGTQAVGQGAARCINGANNIILVSRSAGAHFTAGQYGTARMKAATYGGLDDRCIDSCSVLVDNGMAIGWQFTAAPGEQVERTYLSSYTDVATFANLAPDLALSASDVRSGDPVDITLTVTNRGPSAVTTGAATFALPAGLVFASATGAGTYNPADGQWTIGALAVDQTAQLTIRVTARDAGSYPLRVAQTSSELVDTSPCSSAQPENCGRAATLTVGLVGPVAGADVVSTPFDTPVRVEVLGNDTGTGIHVTAVGASPNGTAVLNDDGTVTFTPAPGFHGDAAFTYAVTDAAGQTATGTVTVTVNAAVATVPPVAPPPGLAATGSTIAVGAIVAAVLAGAAGLVFLLIARRRRSREEDEAGVDES